MRSAAHLRASLGGCRFDRERAEKGHYESYFHRANHPARPLAFWLRYTIFCPRGAPERAQGELWGIFFDGETGAHVAVKSELPMDRCAFDRARATALVGDATIGDRELSGTVTTGAHTLAWALSFERPQASSSDPLLLLPQRMYDAGFPKAKALVLTPNTVYRGTVTVDGRAHDIDGWTGSENHNWGERHTDSYAWGQVASFDGHPGSFLECSTARLRVGRVWTPPLTVCVLRFEGETYALNGLVQSVRAKGTFSRAEKTWSFHSARGGVAIDARFAAPVASFVALPYPNPPGGTKTCLNTKLAHVTVDLARDGSAPVRLESRCRGAFELLDDAADAAVPWAFR